MHSSSKSLVLALSLAPLAAALSLAAGCGDSGGPSAGADAGISDAEAKPPWPDGGWPEAEPPTPTPDAGGGDLTLVSDDPADLPLSGLTTEEHDRFLQGDTIFDLPFREINGLGPLYIRTACGSCHTGGGKGPGLVSKFRVVDATTHVPVADAPEAPDGVTERPYYIAGATKPLLAPSMLLPGHSLVMSNRIGPTVMGRGFIEAIADSEIERVEAEQALRTDGIRGRINRVTYHSQPSALAVIPHSFGETNVIGRFGVKARVATLDDFAADAFQGDMGMTSPMRPTELLNPDGLTDDAHPGVDLDADTVAAVAAYVRTLRIPRQPAAGMGQGPALFESTLCSACHVPSLKTRADFPVKALAGIDAPVYSDLLLHDMGDMLADDQTDESALPREWRTAPLIALRFQHTYLHDGRAKSVEDAVLRHAGPGSQANASVDKWKQLSPAEHAALLQFVTSL